ncbi:MAG: hypothetical protein DRQ97_13125, partial [Gammaproteobacteria bacterium]
DGEFVVSLTDDASVDPGTFVIADSISLKVLPEPLTLQIAASAGSTLDFAWNSLAGKLYDLESTGSLTSPGWSGHGGYTNITAVGTTTETNVPASDPARFFRVIEK